MLTKAEFLASLQREADITSHLVAKLRPEHLAFRLTPAQRSLQELIVFMATQYAGSVAFLTTGSWDAWGAYAKLNADLTPATFAEHMARQVTEVHRLLQDISEQDFARRVVKTPTGVETTLANALLEVTLKWAAGYKMQLFLQAKAAGLGELGTSNLWHGKDPAPKK